MATERIELRVEKGALVPATQRAAALLRSRGYKVGDVVVAEIRRERNPKFHRLVHQIGALCAANIEAFAGLDGHAVIKRIQLEAGIKCEQKQVEMPGIGACLVTIPQSISFAKMDEAEFQELASALCAHVAGIYWPMLTAEQVRELAEAFVE